MSDYVCAPLKRTAVYGSCESVVYDEGHSVAVCHIGKAFDVEYLASRVGDSLSKETFGVGAETGFDSFVVPFGVYESTFDAELLERDTKEVESASVDVV